MSVFSINFGLNNIFDLVKPIAFCYCFRVASQLIASIYGTREPMMISVDSEEKTDDKKTNTENISINDGVFINRNKIIGLYVERNIIRVKVNNSNNSTNNNLNNNNLATNTQPDQNNSTKIMGTLIPEYKGK